MHTFWLPSCLIMNRVGQRTELGTFPAQPGIWPTGDAHSTHAPRLTLSLSFLPGKSALAPAHFGTLTHVACTGPVIRKWRTS